MLQIDNDGNIIVNQEEWKNKRKAADKYIESNNLSSEQISYLRRKCKSNLFYLCYSVLGHIDLNQTLHAHLCKWVHESDHSENLYRLLLIPRFHFKSTILTVADSIRVALPDDIGDSPHPHCLGTNARILIGHEVAETAQGFLFEITQHLVNNMLLMALFPEIVPQLGKQRMNLKLLDLPRTRDSNAGTFNTIGVGGAAQGRHFDMLKLDDLVGEEARKSKTVMQGTKQWFDGVLALLTDLNKDRMDLIGTRWAFDDVYSHAIEQYGTQLIKYIRPAEEKKNGKLVPIFPERFPAARLAILKKNPINWRAWFENDPDSGGAEFDATQLRYYYWKDSKHIIVFNGQNQTVLDIRDMDVIIMIDPALTGNAGFIVTATDKLNRIFILDARKQVWTPPQLVDLIFKSVLKWNPRLVAIESVLFSGLFGNIISREMDLRKIRFTLRPVTPKEVKAGEKGKEARIKGLANFLAAGQMYINEGHAELLQEFRHFGASDDIHILDALAYGPLLWRRGLTEKDLKEQDEANDFITRARNSMTGYSR